MRIQIDIFRDRRKLGTLRLLDGDRELFACPCLARADALGAAQVGNPTRDPYRRNGDTPTGTYRGTIDPPRVPARDPERARWLRSFGQWQTIRMTPTSGDALIAHNNGRRGLLIHGGDLSPTRTLRPANGCVRVENKHQWGLLEQLQKANATEFPITITEVF